MSQVLKELSRRPSRASQYPLDEWFDGKPRRLFQGKNKDFECHPKSLGQYLRTVASKRRLRITVILFDNAVEVQTLGPMDGQSKRDGKRVKAA